MKQAAGFILSLLVLLSGCVSVNPDQEFSEVSKEALSRTDQVVRWEQTPEDEAWTRRAIQEFLVEGLTRVESVSLALLNNRQLQAQFETLGIAKADLVQAGLYTNPTLEGLLGIPFKPAAIEAGFPFVISDLWNVPLRRDVAAVDVMRTTQLIIQQILETAAEARNAFDELLLQESLLQFQKRKVALLETTLEQIQARFNAGLANKVDIFLGQNVLYEARVELVMVRADLKRAHARFVTTMGLDPLSDEDVHVHGDLEQVSPRLLTLEQAWAFARNHRVDLALTRLQIVQTKRLVALQKARIFGDVGAGPGFHHAEGGDANEFGMTLDLEIPVFNQNQGGIARAEFQVRQAEKQLMATELAAKRELQHLLAKLDFHAAHVQMFRNTMRKMQKEVEDYVERFYQSMQFNSIYLIQARERNLDARQSYLNALRQYRLAESLLQVALGGQLTENARQGNGNLLPHDSASDGH